jgi:hypothetical protein
MRLRLVVLLLAAVAAAPTLASAAEHRAAAPGFAQSLLTSAAGFNGFVEPRIAVAPDGAYVVTTTETGPTPGPGTQIVFRSTDGGRNWPRTASNPFQHLATPDVEVVATRTGRLVTVALQSSLALQTSYSDDGGKTWRPGTSLGSSLDTDRPWLAVGPDDPVTKQPRVYLTWHNITSGVAVHEILVATSTDGGRTFGAPVPVTRPGEQAFLDLQCGDGYPSSIAVDRATGQVHVAFGTRTSAVGGCGAQPVQFNIVTPTRVWVASSPNGASGTWTQGLAVDRSGTPGVTLPAIFSPMSLDSAGNAYVVFTESSTPDLVGAVRYVWSPPGARRWSAPVTLARPAGGAIVPHVQAGDAGRVAFTWYQTAIKDKAAPWYLAAAVIPDARAARPKFSAVRVSGTVLFTGPAAELLGQCSTGTPVSGIANGLGATCSHTRAPDNYGTAVDRHGRLVLTYPGFLGKAPGTYVAVQRSGTLLRAR